jgi:serine/threonine-protein kinase
MSEDATKGTMIQDSAPPAEPAPEEEPGATDLTGVVLLGRYKVVKQLGQGGMGTVYLGEHTTIKKKFAIKVLAPEFAHKSDLVERFLQEARAASMIPQQNVVEITDFGDTPDGSVFFVMEHLNGEDLSDTVKREGAIPWSRVEPIMEQVCDALFAAHDVGIIHRDMKPENCFRIKRGSNEDFIKVLDFGIAKVTSDEGEGKGLTRTGMIFGTPEYMSPEQAQGQKVDHRVDVYAAGVIMYELLTGRVPFTADTFMGILTKHMFDVPEAPSAVNPDNGITAEMEAIILKAMQKDRDLRFQDMNEMKEAIMAVGTGASAVQVVSENIARPDGGQMSFEGGAAPAGTYPPAAGTYPPPGGTYPPAGGTYPPMEQGSSSKAGLIVGLLLLLGLGGGAGFYFGVVKPKADQEAAAAAKAAAAESDKKDAEIERIGKLAEQAAAKQDAPAEPPKEKVIAATTPTVVFTINTPGIDADILDAADGARYGKTNDSKGVKVEKSSEMLALVLRADGYEEKRIEIKPNMDKTFEHELKKIRKRPTSTTKKKKKASTTTTPKPTPTPPPTKKATTKKKKKVTRASSPDLKDPFG